SRADGPHPQHGELLCGVLVDHLAVSLGSWAAHQGRAPGKYIHKGRGCHVGQRYLARFLDVRKDVDVVGGQCCEIDTYKRGTVAACVKINDDNLTDLTGGTKNALSGPVFKGVIVEDKHQLVILVGVEIQYGIVAQVALEDKDVGTGATLETVIPAPPLSASSPRPSVRHCGC
ncbi:MAG: hypothetical protein ABJH45_03785, partial [Paracoccaceae bacterium]